MCTSAVKVLSGGERTRLAVARMLLRPSNVLLLDEPTNHLDLDSKEVLLDALIDYGGTLVFVSHDRYFVERLATKIIEVGDGQVIVYPGTYAEFLWHKAHPQGQDGRDGRDTQGGRDRQDGKKAPAAQPAAARARRDAGAKRDVAPPPPHTHEEKKRVDAEARKREKAVRARAERLADLEARISACENTIRDVEAEMSAPGFYEDRAAAQPVIDRHQALMWEVGELMHQWEELQNASDTARASKA